MRLFAQPFPLAGTLLKPASVLARRLTFESMAAAAAAAAASEAEAEAEAAMQCFIGAPLLIEAAQQTMCAANVGAARQHTPVIYDSAAPSSPSSARSLAPRRARGG